MKVESGNLPRSAVQPISPNAPNKGQKYPLERVHLKEGNARYIVPTRIGIRDFLIILTNNSICYYGMRTVHVIFLITLVARQLISISQ